MSELHGEGLPSQIASHTDLREPNITLFPDVFLKRDIKAEEKYATGVLKGVHCNDANEFIKALTTHKDLVVQYDEIMSSPLEEHTSFSSVDHGQRGLVFRLHMGDRDMAIKLYFNAKGASTIAQSFLEASQIESEIQTYILNKFHEPKKKKNALMEEQKILAETAGFVLGNRVAPEFVPPLDCMLSVNGKPIGHVVSFIPGQPVPVGDVTQFIDDDKALLHKFDDAYLRMHRIYVEADLFPNTKNAIIRHTPHGKEVKLIDLYYAGRLDRDPTVCGPDEFYVSGKIEELDLYGMELSYTEFNKIITEIVPLVEAGRGQSLYSPEDVITGVAQIASKKEYERLLETRNHYQQFIDFLSDQKIPFDINNEKKYISMFFLENEATIAMDSGNRITRFDDNSYKVRAKFNKTDSGFQMARYSKDIDNLEVNGEEKIRAQTYMIIETTEKGTVFTKFSRMFPQSSSGDPNYSKSEIQYTQNGTVYTRFANGISEELSFDAFRQGVYDEFEVDLQSESLADLSSILINKLKNEIESEHNMDQK